MQQVTALVHVFTQAKKAKPANQGYETKNLSRTTATREIMFMVHAILRFQKNKTKHQYLTFSLIHSSFLPFSSLLEAWTHKPLQKEMSFSRRWSDFHQEGGWGGIT